MIFVKNETGDKVYLKGTDIELSTAALVAIGKDLQEILEGNLETIKPVNQKKATVLKSFQTEGGAQNWINFQKKLGKNVEGAIVVKSFDPYGEVGYADPVPVPAPVHVVIEESMAPVAEVVSVKDSDEMFKMMYKKGLISVEGGMLGLSSKFYELLNKYTEKMLADTLKSTEVDENGRSFKEVGEQVLKASSGGGTALTPDGVGDATRKDHGKAGDPAPGLKISEEEASNLEGDSRAESLTPDGVGDSTRQDPGKSGDPAPGLLISQEEADNKNASPESLESSSKNTDDKSVSASPDRSLSVFKSLMDLNNFLAMNKDHAGRPITMPERAQYGKRYSYVAEPKTPKDETLGAYGGRRIR